MRPSLPICPLKIFWTTVAVAAAPFSVLLETLGTFSLVFVLRRWQLLFKMEPMGQPADKRNTSATQIRADMPNCTVRTFRRSAAYELVFGVIGGGHVTAAAAAIVLVDRLQNGSDSSSPSHFHNVYDLARCISGVESIICQELPLNREGALGAVGVQVVLRPRLRGSLGCLALNILPKLRLGYTRPWRWCPSHNGQKPKHGNYRPVAAASRLLCPVLAIENTPRLQVQLQSYSLSLMHTP